MIRFPIRRISKRKFVADNDDDDEEEDLFEKF